jgi:glucose/mannose-6-phosphate isomerase
VLDDLKYIHQKDPQDALGVAEKQWQQLQQRYEAEAISGEGIENIVLAGMGGSALAANMLHTWPSLIKPFEIVRDYNIPAYVNGSTLFIASSYSGNTEETISALAQAEAKGARVVVIAAGGKLEKIAEEKKYPFYKLPGNFQPRMAVFYNFAALIQLLAPMGLAGNGKVEEVHKAAQWLSKHVDNWKADIPTKHNQAKQLALDLVGKSPVIYAGLPLYPAAYKWKINFNENAKNVAWCNQFPEFNHNEFLGWSSHPLDKPYAVIFLKSSFDHPQVKKRFDVSAKLLSGKWPHPIEIDARGDTLLEQLLWIIALGDMVSIYLALLNGLNPSPVELIERLKQALV